MYENGIQKEIVNSDTVKDLGITFDTELKFRKYINDCINKGNRITGLIRRSFLHINCKLFCKLFKTLIRPILEYGNIIWNPRFKKDTEAVERVQKRATKLVHNVRDMSYSLENKIPSLTYRKFRGDMIQVYNLMHNLEDIPFTRFFELNENPTRGHALKLNKSFVRKKTQVSNFWNGLPDLIVTAPTLNTFINPVG